MVMGQQCGLVHSRPPFRLGMCVSDTKLFIFNGNSAHLGTFSENHCCHLKKKILPPSEKSQRGEQEPCKPLSLPYPIFQNCRCNGMTGQKTSGPPGGGLAGQGLVSVALSLPLRLLCSQVSCPQVMSAVKLPSPKRPQNRR